MERDMGKKMGERWGREMGREMARERWGERDEEIERWGERDGEKDEERSNDVIHLSNRVAPLGVVLVASPICVHARCCQKCRPTCRLNVSSTARSLETQGPRTHVRLTLVFLSVAFVFSDPVCRCLKTGTDCSSRNVAFCQSWETNCLLLCEFPRQTGAPRENPLTNGNVRRVTPPGLEPSSPRWDANYHNWNCNLLPFQGDTFEATLDCSDWFTESKNQFALKVSPPRRVRMKGVGCVIRWGRSSGVLLHRYRTHANGCALVVLLIFLQKDKTVRNDINSDSLVVARVSVAAARLYLCPSTITRDILENCVRHTLDGEGKGSHFSLAETNANEWVSKEIGAALNREVLRADAGD
ncbi:hypothetical protein PR048_017711 [Dryococelus australis]|uniref:Uncharacterized protein n=1 Tax=Dryococelus australis TaxID=614101 RepID=A0ABQ9HA87_9NEOP|nr:hypothetical protein PR048_017711 [Dryococelus australis]